jgi:type I restriction enzyme S subunit
MSKVPVGWTLDKLASAIKTLESGVSVNGEDRAKVESEKAVLKVSAVSYGFFNPKASKVIVKEELERAKVNPRADSIIISRSNTENLVGASAYINTDYSDLYLSDKLWQVVLNKNHNMRWLSYFLASDKTRYVLSKLSTGTSGSMKNITKEELLSLEVLIPPLPEQTKIAQILSTWDKAIATTEKLIGNSQQQKKALMQSLLTGKKRLTGFEGEFKYLNFSDVVGIDQQNLKNKTADDFSFKYISLTDVKFGVIEKSLEYISFKNAPSRARRILKEGDILLATVRPNLQGFARVKKEHGEMIASTGFSVLSPKKSFCSDYIFHYLYSDHLTAQIDSLVVGSNYPAINSSDVANLKIFCPEYNEQVEIAKVLNNCLDTIENMQKKLAFLKQEKAALMQQLLTGKRRVKVEAA